MIDANLASSSPEDAASKALENAGSLTGKHLILGTSKFEGLGLNAANINRALDLAAASIINVFPIDGLILTGGDTAEAVFKSLGVQSIKLNGEFEPGIPVGLIDTPRKMMVITKAGGFGNERTLLNAADYLRGSNASPTTMAIS